MRPLAVLTSVAFLTCTLFPPPVRAFFHTAPHPLTSAYDPLGNLTRKEGVTMTYGLTDGSKPHAVTATSDGWTMTYDANGNMLVKDFTQSPNHSITQSLYSYDVENRLIEVKTAQEVTVTLRFEPGWNLFSLPVIPEDPRITTLLPTYGTELDTLARYDPTYNNPFTGQFQHYVGQDPKFDDFTTLDYGRGYQLYCTNPSGVTVTLKGKLPTKPITKALSVGWHLLPALTTDGPKPLSWLLSGVTYDQVYGYNAVTQQLEVATDVKPNHAYYVNVAAGTWTPPLPRDVTTRFVYDGDGGRVKKITAAGTTKFLGESYEIAPDGTTTTYVFVGSQRIAAKDSTSALRFYHPDHLGSSNVVTNGSGAVIELAEYTPYGSFSRKEAAAPSQPLVTGASCSAPFYTGQRLDAETGLYFYHARYYDPTLGRFISPDPIVQAPADPQTLNRYSYVRNNPIVFVDPSGFGFWSKFFGAIAGIFVTVVTGGCIPCGVAAFSFVDTMIASMQAGASFGTAFSLASVNAAIAGAAAVAAPVVGAPAAFAGAGALQGVAGAAITGGDVGHAAWVGAVAGLTSVVAGPIIGGGVGSVLNGGSFGRGATEGAYAVAAVLAIAATAQAVGQGQYDSQSSGGVAKDHPDVAAYLQKHGLKQNSDGTFSGKFNKGEVIPIGKQFGMRANQKTSATVIPRPGEVYDFLATEEMALMYQNKPTGLSTAKAQFAYHYDVKMVQILSVDLSKVERGAIAMYNLSNPKSPVTFPTRAFPLEE